MAKYINMGWLAERAIYIDSRDYQFYTSDIKKNSNGILLFAPVTGTIVGILVSALGSYIGIIQNSWLRLIIVVITCLLLFFASKITVKLLWKKADFMLYNLSSYQKREVLQKAKRQNIIIKIVVFLFGLTVVAFYTNYIVSSEAELLIIATLSLAMSLTLVFDYSPLIRKKIIKQLEREYF
ncbi:hypothetical protein NNC69_05605 [Streptococcus mutans]|uniref:hypothetical protein n=1 Tax=Streptococcus mutans TaxID=1309 RepID=UPI0028EB0F95|nr:hypothetical protein [Streptococcus mutans]MDT9553380.1 hypothetical protein [Streptococcus mutans]MDT9573321.1 hypothetical protein [Streptococcus mutans]